MRYVRSSRDVQIEWLMMAAVPLPLTEREQRILASQGHQMVTRQGGNVYAGGRLLSRLPNTMTTQRLTDSYEPTVILSPRALARMKQTPQQTGLAVNGQTGLVSKVVRTADPLAHENLRRLALQSVMERQRALFAAVERRNDASVNLQLQHMPQQMAAGALPIQSKALNNLFIQASSFQPGKVDFNPNEAYALMQLAPRFRQEVKSYGIVAKEEAAIRRAQAKKEKTF